MKKKLKSYLIKWKKMIVIIQRNQKIQKKMNNKKVKWKLKCQIMIKMMKKVVKVQIVMIQMMIWTMNQMKKNKRCKKEDLLHLL